VEDVSLLRREGVAVLIGIDELVTLVGRHASHATDRAIDGLSAIRRKLLELLKNLASSLLLILRQVLPGFHATQHALLLLRRQAGKMLQSLQQTGLLGRREPAELGIVFKRVPLLRGR
jgi:ribosomal protein S19E (S16A)